MNFKAEGEGIGFWIIATVVILGYVAFWATVLWLIWFAIVRFS